VKGARSAAEPDEDLVDRVIEGPLLEVARLGRAPRALPRPADVPVRERVDEHLEGDGRGVEVVGVERRADLSGDRLGE
jgi:hypothetical protein